MGPAPPWGPSSVDLGGAGAQRRATITRGHTARLCGALQTACKHTHGLALILRSHVVLCALPSSCLGHFGAGEDTSRHLAFSYSVPDSLAPASLPWLRSSGFFQNVIWLRTLTLTAGLCSPSSLQPGWPDTPELLALAGAPPLSGPHSSLTCLWLEAEPSCFDPSGVLTNAGLPACRTDV